MAGTKVTSNTNNFYMYTSEPEEAKVGDIYMDMDTKKVYTYVGDNWVETEVDITEPPPFEFSQNPLVIKINSTSWWISNCLDIFRWLDEGNGRVDKATHTIVLNDEKSISYFGLRWGQ